MLSKKNLSSPIVLILLAALVIFLAKLKWAQYQNQKTIAKLTQNLQQQADSLQKENNDLTQSLAYLNSADAKEKIAREQLNYKREGEQVYSFTDVAAPAPEAAAFQPPSSNFRRWWDYFFAD